MEFKGGCKRPISLISAGINRNIMEFKAVFPLYVHLYHKGINRNIMEFKELYRISDGSL